MDSDPNEKTIKFIRNWAISIGYLPQTDTETELAQYIGNQTHYLYCLTRSAAINEEINTLNWLDKHNILNTNDVVISVAAHSVLSMIKYCIDKGYDTTECCHILRLNNHLTTLKWLENNGCKCDKSKNYH